MDKLPEMQTLRQTKKVDVLCKVTSCSLLDIYQSFEGTSCFYFQERELTLVRKSNVSSGNRKSKQVTKLSHNNANLSFDVQNKIKKDLIRNMNVYKLVLYNAVCYVLDRSTLSLYALWRC